MIPHHSLAILTTENADIQDICGRELADEIIEAQQREIKEMNWLLARLCTFMRHMKRHQSMYQNNASGFFSYHDYKWM